MKENNSLEKNSIELLLLSRILYKLEKLEISHSILLVDLELKTLQEKGILTGYRMRFNDIDENLGVIKEDVRRIRRDRVPLGIMKKTMEIVMDRYFVREEDKKSWFKWF